MLAARLPSIADIDAEIARRAELQSQARTEKAKTAERRRQTQRRGGLLSFVRYFWSVLEPRTAFVEGWPLEAICEHLEAVTFGELTKLLINVPPGFMKSLLVDVFWPAWEWGPMDMPHMRYVAFSYTPDLTERDNGRFRDLIQSERYQSLWGERFALVKTGAHEVTNDRTGFKFASSVGGVSTGQRGSRVILDDPHNVKVVESQLVREETVRWFRESMSNRLNDMKTSAIVVIMQRLHMDDVSGEILSREFNYCHLMIPMEFDPSIYPAEGYTGNDIGWIDPRALNEDGEMLPPFELDQREGELAWPERFPADVVSGFKYELGPHAYAGQYAQSPMARKGGIFDLSWWNVWEPPESGKFPPMQFVIASLDSAFTEKEENDPSGFTVWGVWIDEEGVKEDIKKSLARGATMSPAEAEAAVTPEMFEGRVPKVMLMTAWRKHLKIHGSHDNRKTGESYDKWARRTMKDWGLCEWVAHSCRRFDIDVLLIEAKASGLSVAQEMERLYAAERWSVRLAQAPRDKTARALSVQPAWSQGIIYSPVREWSEMVKNEMATFPKHRYKDLTDSATHAIAWLRRNGLIQRPEEMARLIRARSEFRKPAPVLYHA